MWKTCRFVGGVFFPFFLWKFSKSDLFASSPRDEPRHWCVSQPPMRTHIWGMVWQWMKWPGWNSWTAMRHIKLRIQIHWISQQKITITCTSSCLVLQSLAAGMDGNGRLTKNEDSSRQNKGHKKTWKASFGCSTTCARWKTQKNDCDHKHSHRNENVEALVNDVSPNVLP